jgi:glutathione S-transferase
MPYTLYYAPDSANLVIRMALEEMGLPYQQVLVDRDFKEHHQPEFLALNPQGLIPVLIDADQQAPLFETAAILLHLAQKHGQLWPTNAGQTGDALKWLFYLSNTLHADLRVMFYTERYLPSPEAVATLRQGIRARIAGHFALLEQQIAKSQGPWLLGSVFSVCDVYLAVCARWALIYPRGDACDPSVISSCPQLSQLIRRLEQRQAVQTALGKEGLLQANGAPLSAPQLPAPAAPLNTSNTVNNA